MSRKMFENQDRIEKWSKIELESNNYRKLSFSRKVIENQIYVENWSKNEFESNNDRKLSLNQKMIGNRVLSIQIENRVRDEKLSEVKIKLKTGHKSSSRRKNIENRFWVEKLSKIEFEWKIIENPIRVEKDRKSEKFQLKNDRKLNLIVSIQKLKKQNQN